MIEEGDQIIYAQLNSTEIQEEDTTIPKEIQAFLEGYSYDFAKLHGLPPSRAHGHHILLVDGAQPLKLKPYRYPYLHNLEIENLVKESFEDGVIQPSNSPFVSPISLDKKKDRSWRVLCGLQAA